MVKVNLIFEEAQVPTRGGCFGYLVRDSRIIRTNMEQYGEIKKLQYVIPLNELDVPSEVFKPIIEEIISIPCFRGIKIKEEGVSYGDNHNCIAFEADARMKADRMILGFQHIRNLAYSNSLDRKVYLFCRSEGFSITESSFLSQQVFKRHDWDNDSTHYSICGPGNSHSLPFLSPRDARVWINQDNNTYTMEQKGFNNQRGYERDSWYFSKKTYHYVNGGKVTKRMVYAFIKHPEDYEVEGENYIKNPYGSLVDNKYLLNDKGLRDCVNAIMDWVNEGGVVDVAG